jgi:hypothetical protein
MPIENTDLERRVLAHEQILQALMAQLSQGVPQFLNDMQDRFTSVRRGAHEHDYVETADYAEAFLIEVARLANVKPVPKPEAPKAATPQTERTVLASSDAVCVLSVKRNGIWHVTQDGQFVGDYLSEAPARLAAFNAVCQVERLGGRATLQFDPVQT